MMHETPSPGKAPGPASLIEQARARLANELARLPPWGSAALWQRLHADDPRTAMTLGALTHYIRRAAASGNARAKRELFELLLERIAGLNGRWAARTVARTARLAGSPDARDDLLQELTLHLWEQIAVGTGEGWELFFQRSLDFAQRHVATAFLARRGDQAPVAGSDSAGAVDRLVLSLSTLTHAEPGERAGGLEASLSEPADPFTSAELADLRALVQRLPERERAVIVMRFWQDASEAEMAHALMVSTRTIRNYARQAYNLLRGWYGTPGESNG